MGDPNATATPAALDAVRISLIFAASRSQHGELQSSTSQERVYTHYGFQRIEKSSLQQRFRRSTRRGRTGPPCRQTDPRRWRAATKKTERQSDEVVRPF